MKKILLTLLFFGTFCIGGLVVVNEAEAVVSYVQSASADVRGGASVSVSYGSTPSSNNLLVVVCATESNRTFNTPSGFSVAINQSGTPSQAIFYKVATGSESSIQCSWTGGNSDGAIHIYEYSGTATTVSVLVDVTGSNTGSSSSPSTGNINTTNKNNLLFTAFTVNNTNTAFSSWGGSFTDPERQDFSTSSGPGSGRDNYAGTDRYVTSTGTYAANATSGNGAWRAQIVAFKESFSLSGTSNLPSGTVAVAVNGTRQAITGSISGGNWTINDISVDTGDVVTAWVDSATDGNETTGVAKFDGTGTTMTGMVLNQHVLTVGSSDNQSFTVTDFSLYDGDTGSDGGDEDVMHTSNSGTLEVGAGGSYTDHRIHILSGNTLTVGSAETLSTHDIEIDGTLTSTATASYTISGSWNNDSVFNRGTSTITFTSTGSETIDSTGASTSDLYDIVFNGSGGSWSLTTALVANDITSRAGTLSGSQSVTVEGGDLVCDTTCGSISLTSGTLTLEGSGDLGSSSLASNWTFAGLTLGDGTSATTTAQGSGTVSVTGVFTIASNQSFNAGSKTYSLNGSGTPFIVNGTFSADSSTVNYIGTASTTVANETYSALGVGVGANSSNVTFALANDTTVTGVLTVGASSGTGVHTLDASTYTLTLSGSGTPFVVNSQGSFDGSSSTVNYEGTSATNVASLSYNDVGVGTAADASGVTFTLLGDTTVTGIFTVGNGSSTATDTVDFSSHIVTLSGSGTPLVLTAQGTVTTGTSTVNYTGTSATNINAFTYNNLGVGTSANSSSVTYSLLGDITVGGVLTIGADSGSGVHTLDGDSRTITLTGSGTPIDINSQGAFTEATSTVSYEGTSATNIADHDYYVLEVGTNANSSTVTFTLTGNIDVASTLTVGASSGTGVHTLDASTYTLTLSGSGTPLVVNSQGSFDGSSSTVNYEGTSATNITDVLYNNLGVGTDTDANAVTFSVIADLSVSGVLTVGASSGSTDVLDASTYTLTLSGSGTPLVVNSAGSFTEGSSTVNYTGAAATNVAGEDYNNLGVGTTADSNAATFTLLGDTTIAGTVTVGNASSLANDTLDLSSRTFTLNASGTPLVLTAWGLLEAGTSTVEYHGDSATNITSTTYYDLDLGTDGDANAVTYSAAGDLTIEHVLTVGAASGATDTFAPGSTTVHLEGTNTAFDIQSAGSFDEGTSTLSYENISSANVAAETYYNLQFAPASGSPLYTMASGTISVLNDLLLNGAGNPRVTAETNDPTLTVDGNFEIGSGDEFLASSTGTFVISGDFTNNGTFTANSGTVEFDDVGQISTLSYSGDTTFYGLVVDTPTKTVLFDDTYQTNVTGLLTLDGGSCDNEVVIDSETDTDQFDLNVTASGGNITIDYVAIEDSNAVAALTASNSTNNGNNNGWTINAGACAPVPTKIVFTTSARTLTAGNCNGAGNVVTIQLQDGDDAPQNPSGTTVVRVSSTSPDYTIYSDDSCSTTVANGDFSFSTSENTKNVYVVDRRKSNPTWTLSASKQSGPETLASDTQSMTINAGSVTRLVVTLPNETFTDGVGNSGTVSDQTAGSSFVITSISATDDYFNVNQSYSGTQTLGYSGPGDAPDTTSPSYITSVDFTSGQSTTTLTTTLYLAETTTITVTDGGQYGYASSSVTVDPDTVSLSASDSTVVGSETVSQTDEGVVVTVTLRDQYLNPVSGVSGGDITFVGTTATFAVDEAPTNTNASGVSTAVLSWSDTGSKTITANVSGVGTLLDTHTLDIRDSTKPRATLRGGSGVRGGTQL